jgi:hypothetical protein
MNQNKRSIEERLDDVYTQAESFIRYVERLPDHAKDAPATNRDLCMIASWFLALIGDR